MSRPAPVSHALRLRLRLRRGPGRRDGDGDEAEHPAPPVHDLGAHQLIRGSTRGRRRVLRPAVSRSKFAVQEASQRRAGAVQCGGQAHEPHRQAGCGTVAGERGTGCGNGARDSLCGVFMSSANSPRRGPNSWRRPVCRWCARSWTSPSPATTPSLGATRPAPSDGEHQAMIAALALTANFVDRIDGPGACEHKLLAAISYALS